MNMNNKKRVLLSACASVALVAICIIGFAIANQNTSNPDTSNESHPTSTEKTLADKDSAKESASNSEANKGDDTSAKEQTTANSSETHQEQNTDQQSTTNDSNTTSKSDNQSANNSSTSQNSQGDYYESAQSQNQDASTITIKVIVTGSGYGDVNGGGMFTLPKDASAYDALKACNMNVNASNTQYGIYVSAINGLAEKEHGSMSGWLYSVNGVTPNVACSTYKLKGGDEVKWFYSGE